MEKMWAGRFQMALDAAADVFNASIRVDQKMYKQDIMGSIAHAAMLVKTHILTDEEGLQIVGGLQAVLSDLESGALSVDPAAEDIHMFVEAVLTKRLGDVGKKLHTGRSRNDQVAVDVRMYLRDRTAGTRRALLGLIGAVCDKAAAYKDAVMPGYTHLQRAQPITFGHHLSAYCMMFMRDFERLGDAARRMNVCPLGSAALAGTTYPIDRAFTAEQLGFDSYCLNSLDGVSDRDFCVELGAALALVMTHLSRFSEEIILWSSWEFKFIELDDAYTTGSSIMPQKKNPDMAELVRGKTGRVFGDLTALLTMLKGLPLAYNKDMQEDKEAVFDAFDTVDACLGVFTPMVATMTALPENMRAAAGKGFINATDLADWLVGKGLPFRSAYKVVGNLVHTCIERGETLESLPLADYRAFSELFDETLYAAIDLDACVQKRNSAGGTGAESVKTELEAIAAFLEKNKDI